MARWVESGRSWEHVPDEIASQTRCESDVDAIVAAAILAALTPEPQVRFSVRHDDDGRCPTVVELGAEVIDELAAGRPVGLVIDEAVIELRIAGGLGAAFGAIGKALAAAGRGVQEAIGSRREFHRVEPEPGVPCDSAKEALAAMRKGPPASILAAAEQLGARSPFEIEPAECTAVDVLRDKHGRPLQVDERREVLEYPGGPDE